MSNRKLLMEMDRTSKETTRALQEYDEINKKLSQSLEGNHTTRSEKLFLDLKRDHLGKVIRLRHQIKVWLDGNDSDHIPFEKKQALGELKTMCESRMEEFDKRERLYKTRGFRKDDMEADNETISWVKQMCEEMRQQKEVIEGELELQRKDEDLKHRLLAFNYHLFHLELILRGLTNKALDEKEIDELRRDLQDFLNGDLDLDEDSDFYEHLDLNSKLESFIDEVTVFSQPNQAAQVQAAAAAAAAAAAEAAKPTAKQTPSQKKQEQKRQQESQTKTQAAPTQTAAVTVESGPKAPAVSDAPATKVVVVMPEPLADTAAAATAAATAAKNKPQPPPQVPTAWQQPQAPQGVLAPPPQVAAVPAPPPQVAATAVVAATPPRLPSFPPRSRLTHQQQQTPMATPLSTPFSASLGLTPGGSARLPSLVKVPIPPLPQRLLLSPLIASPSSVLDSVSDEDFLVFLEQSRNSGAVNLLASFTPTRSSSSQHLLSPHLLFKPLTPQPPSHHPLPLTTMGEQAATTTTTTTTTLSEEEELLLRMDVIEFLRVALLAGQSSEVVDRTQRIVMQCAVQHGARVDLSEVQLAPFAIQLQKEGLELEMRQRIIKELRERRN
ncbi:hypothetical protein BASA81_017553 [Batrachochytrium salamandrivorans]|nr:hypothetical protein BASA81_017553 [Batrachochytrium salamandrivorans]